jgi:maltose alpha-D-glucosyltransferase / alpha-amylase
MDPIYGYQGLNVEAQERMNGSLLNWTRRMIDIRKRHPVFALGEYHELNSSNPSVLAFVREYRSSDAEAEDDSKTDRMLCVNNLSRYPQPVELDLSRFAGYVPVETMGGVAFPPIGELSYLLTLPGYGFYWLMLKPPANYGP